MSKIKLVIENVDQSYWRADIQGLRALAVFGVIAFHLDLPIKSGFLGVDVFIVVSGYVITGLLLREIKVSDQIRVLRFFKRRFLRLFPAHVVMLGVTLLTFYFIGPSSAHKAALNQARASVAFMANIYFFARSKDYFALEDDFTLFLNTWSLALEEQFYFIFALLIALLILIAQKSRAHLAELKILMCWIFIGLVFVSITLAIISSEIWSGENIIFRTSTIHPREWVDFLVSRGADFAFYSPLTRAWQFLIGALLALRSFEKAKTKKLKSSGLIIIALVSVLTFATAQETVFLTWSRLGATFLTAAIIFRGSTWLSKEWLVSIGDRSYSLYLWHYPVIVIFKGINSDWVFVASLLFIALFAELSFHFVEKPFRQLNINRYKKRRIARTLPTALVLLSFCVVVLRLDIAAKNFIDRSHFIAESSEISHSYDERTSCWSDGPDLTCGEDLRGSVLLVGDSHAGSLRPGFFKAMKSLDLKPRFRDGRCLFAAFDRNVKAAEASGCDEIGVGLQAEIISQNPQIVVFLICGRIHDSCPEGLESESKEDWVNAGRKALQPILDAGIPIALVRDLPVLNPDPRYASTVARIVLNLPIRNFEIHKRYKQISQTRFERLFFELQPSKSELFEVDFLNSICSKDLCNAKTRAGLNIWQDSDHLSVEGSIEIANAIAREVLEIIKD